jgi:hypothetical protein
MSDKIKINYTIKNYWFKNSTNIISSNILQKNNSSNIVQNYWLNMVQKIIGLKMVHNILLDRTILIQSQKLSLHFFSK